MNRTNKQHDWSWEDKNKETPGGASLHSLTLNTLDYSTIVDTLKAHALAVVSNAHSEMSDQQFDDFINELTPAYAQAIQDYIRSEVIGETTDRTPDLSQAPTPPNTPKDLREQLDNELTKLAHNFGVKGSIARLHKGVTLLNLEALFTHHQAAVDREARIDELERSIATRQRVNKTDVVDIYSEARLSELHQNKEQS